MLKIWQHRCRNCIFNYPSKKCQFYSISHYCLISPNMLTSGDIGGGGGGGGGINIHNSPVRRSALDMLRPGRSDDGKGHSSQV